MTKKTPGRSHTKSPYNWQSSREAADIIGIHVNHLRTIPASELRYYLIGHIRRYRADDVEKYIESLAVTS